MKITLITVGKIKEKFFQDAIAEYSKRLSRYCKLEIIQVADEKTPDGASEAVETQIKEKEGERILQKIPDGAFVVALAIDGKMLDSEELAGQMERWNVGGISHVVLDMLTPSGIPLHPFSRKNKLSFRVCSTGSVGEYVFLGVMLVLLGFLLGPEMKELIRHVRQLGMPVLHF